MTPPCSFRHCRDAIALRDAACRILAHAACPLSRAEACDLLPTRPLQRASVIETRAHERQRENAVKYFNRLAHREFLILVAIAASAISLHVREHVVDSHAQQASHSTYGRVCEQPAPDAGEARMLPADCAIRSNVRTVHAQPTWV
jgi:hypothetical protein